MRYVGLIFHAYKPDMRVIAVLFAVLIVLVAIQSGTYHTITEQVSILRSLRPLDWLASFLIPYIGAIWIIRNRKWADQDVTIGKGLALLGVVIQLLYGANLNWTDVLLAMIVLGLVVGWNARMLVIVIAGSSLFLYDAVALLVIDRYMEFWTYVAPPFILYGSAGLISHGCKALYQYLKLPRQHVEEESPGYW